MKTKSWFPLAVLTAILHLGTPVAAWARQDSTANATVPHLTVGLFFASIEEGARIFTPVRLLPFEHPEALGHEFPTVLQFHGGEDALLVTLGREAGLLLGATLQRYPRQPNDTWPYDPYQPPPVDQFTSLTTHRQPAEAAPLPGLRAVAFLDRFPLAFIVDTRGMSLAERRMERGTTSGLDVTRAELQRALRTAAAGGPPEGPWMLVYNRE